MSPQHEKNSSEARPGSVPRRIIKFTCPECGSGHLFRGWPGYVCRQFIKAIACQPSETPETADQSDEHFETHLVFERLPDGSINVDYDEDNYERSRCGNHDFFACAECEQVLQFDDGSDVKGQNELVEWLKAHQTSNIGRYRRRD
jgi:hypothetical protein